MIKHKVNRVIKFNEIIEAKHWYILITAHFYELNVYKLTYIFMKNANSNFLFRSSHSNMWPQNNATPVQLLRPLS